MPETARHTCDDCLTRGTCFMSHCTKENASSPPLLHNSGPVHTNPDIFETAYLFIRIGLPSTRNHVHGQTMLKRYSISDLKRSMVQSKSNEITARDRERKCCKFIRRICKRSDQLKNKHEYLLQIQLKLTAFSFAVP